jgi:hypothetical protein
MVMEVADMKQAYDGRVGFSGHQTLSAPTRAYARRFAARA